MTHFKETHRHPLPPLFQRILCHHLPWSNHDSTFACDASMVDWRINRELWAGGQLCAHSARGEFYQLSQWKPCRTPSPVVDGRSNESYSTIQCDNSGRQRPMNHSFSSAAAAVVASHRYTPAVQCNMMWNRDCGLPPKSALSRFSERDSGKTPTKGLLCVIRRALQFKVCSQWPTIPKDYVTQWVDKKAGESSALELKWMEQWVLSNLRKMEFFRRHLFFAYLYIFGIPSESSLIHRYTAIWHIIYPKHTQSGSVCAWALGPGESRRIRGWGIWSPPLVSFRNSFHFVKKDIPK